MIKNVVFESDQRECGNLLGEMKIFFSFLRFINNMFA